MDIAAVNVDDGEIIIEGNVPLVPVDLLGDILLSHQSGPGGAVDDLEDAALDGIKVIAPGIKMFVPAK